MVAPTARPGAVRRLTRRSTGAHAQTAATLPHRHSSTRTTSSSSRNSRVNAPLLAQASNASLSRRFVGCSSHCPQRALAHQNLSLHVVPDSISGVQRLRGSAPRRSCCRRGHGVPCRASSASFAVPEEGNSNGRSSNGASENGATSKRSRDYLTTPASKQFQATIGSAGVPPPPKRADKFVVIIYLGRLAASDAGLLWRLFIALVGFATLSCACSLCE